MSPQSFDDGTVELNPKARRLSLYLKAELQRRDSDALYVKGRDVADEVDMSPQEIGTMLRRLQEDVTDLTVEKWAYSKATTWKITDGEQ